MTHWQHERWRAQTGWYRPTLTHDDVAALLGPVHSTIVLQLATLSYRRGPGEEDLRWSPAELYTHIAQYHPGHTSFIPRWRIRRFIPRWRIRRRVATAPTCRVRVPPITAGLSDTDATRIPVTSTSTPAARIASIR
jgi:hypothetical protein